MNKHQRLVPWAPDWLRIEEQDNGFALIDTRDDGVTYLNRSSALIWCLCDGGFDLQGIVDRIHDRHPEAENIELDVLSAIRDFIRSGLLRIDGREGVPVEMEYRLDDLQRETRQKELEAAGILPLPARKSSGGRRLTVAMAVYDDFDGVYFTIQSIRLHHPEVLDDIDFLVLDNNPLGPAGESIRAFATSVPNLRYVPEVRSVGTAIRGRLFELADTPCVLCLDCHVLLAPGSLARLLRYFEHNPNTPDLLQGPLLRDGLGSCMTHMEPRWSDGMYGAWAHDERGDDPEAEPFDIPMQGLGLFACRRNSWPSFNRDFHGFGGEEGYIHGKFRRAGGRTLCLPFLRWIHRFGRPGGVPYAIRWEDRIMNYLIGFNELEWDTTPVKKHFTELLGGEVVAGCEATYRALFNRSP
jgi:hypothetical protein